MIVNSLFKKTKLQMWQTIRQEELNRKKFFRKRLRFETDNLRLIKENAKQIIIAKLQKKKNDEKKRIDAQFMKFWRMKRNDVHAKNVIVRKTKKARIKQIKEMTKSHFFISVELLQLIHDLEVEWKRINETWLIEQEKKNRRTKSRFEKSIEEEENDDKMMTLNL